MRHEDEPVTGVGLDVAVDLRGDVLGGADELLPAGDRDDQLSDRKVLGLSTFAVAAGYLDRVAVPHATLGDAGVTGRIVRRQRAVGIVFGQIAAPDLLEHRDRRRAADLLVPNVAAPYRRLRRRYRPGRRSPPGRP